jgi:transcriptional regulator GlxA family with amidase domain
MSTSNIVNQLEMKKSVVIVAMTNQLLLDFTGPSDVFTSAEKCLQETRGIGGYNVQIVAPTWDRKMTTPAGMEISYSKCAMEIEEPIDTLIISGNDNLDEDWESLIPFYKWLSGINQHNTRRIASVCSGTFALAKVGMLDGRRATTHWNVSEKLKRDYPRIQVNANAFFTKDGHIYTSAGVSSGIDLALALVEEDFGKDISIFVARKLVFYLSRPGFQMQFGNLLPTYESTSIGRLLATWLNEHMHEPLEVKSIARNFNMSVRTLTRALQKHTGMPPAKFIEKFRVEHARKLLEDSDLPVERIAEQCGLRNLVSMRRVFLRHLMTTPSDYRRTFRSSLKTLQTIDGLGNKLD